MKKNLYYLKFPLTLKVIALQAFIVLLDSAAAFAQTASLIKGTVTDGQAGTPLPGVTVSVKGTNTVVATNVNGEYSITATLPATLIFRSVGYTLQEIPVNNQTTLNVKMQVSAS